MVELEKVVLATIYKKDGWINIDFTNDGDKGFEVYGFLKCLLNKLEEDLTNSLGDKNANEME